MFNSILYKLFILTIKELSKNIFFLLQKTCKIFFFKILKFICTNRLIIKIYKNYIYKLVYRIWYINKLEEDLIIIYQFCINIYYFFKIVLIKLFNFSKTNFVLKPIFKTLFVISPYIISALLTVYVYEKQSIKNAFLRYKKKITRFISFVLKASIFYFELWVYKTIFILILYILKVDYLTILWFNFRWSRIYFVLYNTLESIERILHLYLYIAVLQCMIIFGYLTCRLVEEVSWGLANALLIPHFKVILVWIVCIFIKLIEYILIFFNPIITSIYVFITTLTIILPKCKIYLFLEYWLNVTPTKLYLNTQLNKFFFNSIWNYILITTVIVSNLISLTLILKTWDCSKSINKYRFVLGFFLYNVKFMTYFTR